MQAFEIQAIYKISCVKFGELKNLIKRVLAFIGPHLAHMQRFPYPWTEEYFNLYYVFRYPGA